jgi:hypothetical protein
VFEGAAVGEIGGNPGGAKRARTLAAEPRRHWWGTPQSTPLRADGRLKRRGPPTGRNWVVDQHNPGHRRCDLPTGRQ